MNLETQNMTSPLCRICYDDKNEPLITPCQCKGSVAFIHKSCLQRWLLESNATHCELCHIEFNDVYSTQDRTNLVICRQQLHRQHERTIQTDIVYYAVVAPICVVIITYICLLVSENYDRERFIWVPAVGWTTVCLLILSGIVIVGYYLWIYSIIKLQSRMWANLQERNYLIRYTPASNQHLFLYNTSIENATLLIPLSLELANNNQHSSNPESVARTNYIHNSGNPPRVNCDSVSQV